MKIRGRVWKFGDHVDTDVIIPARFLNVSDKAELARHCFADLRPEFAEAVQRGDVIVAGRNFGCGSSREHAPLAIKAAGISLVAAGSFARIFYRNAFNTGLPILECEDVFQICSDGGTVTADLETGEMRSGGKDLPVFAKPIPAFMRDIIEAGGLVPYIKARGSL